MHALARNMSPATLIAAYKAYKSMSAVLSHPAMWAVLLAIAVINATLYVLILNWALAVRKDPKCACAKDWKLTYCMVFPPVAMALTLLATWALSSAPSTHAMYAMLAVLAALVVGWVVLAISAFRYVNKLARTDCACATSHMIGDEALQVFAALKVAWWGVLSLILLSTGFVVARKLRAV
jgi:hypothetical protein